MQMKCSKLWKEHSPANFALGQGKHYPNLFLLHIRNYSLNLGVHTVAALHCCMDVNNTYWQKIRTQPSGSL